MLLLTAGSLLWFSLRALWVRIAPPEGEEITAEDAPELFQALAQIRRKVKGPVIHHVLLNEEFNASIQQVPRYGLFGGGINYLIVGLPLLMALDRGRFGAWICRTRWSWMQLNKSLSDDTSLASIATQAFLRWYCPRFAAKTFAMVRQDEYEADYIAGRLAGCLAGREVMASALIEVEIRGCWFQTEFWHDHWCMAASHALPVGPYHGLRRLLARTPDAAFASDALRQALKRISNLDDTHPGLRYRLEALDAAGTLPEWSHGSALTLLGAEFKVWIDRFDRRWCASNATEWKLHHAWLQRVRARAEALQAGMAQASAAELVELARLRGHLNPHAEVRPLYELALQRSAEHPAALRGLVLSLAAGDRDAKMACLHRLWDAGSNDRWWAARTALAELETPRMGHDYDPDAFKQWRKRLERAQESEERAWEELSHPAYFSHIARHDLSEFELGEFQAELARCTPIARAWLVRKNLREHPRRRAYLLFLELPGMDDENRYDL